MEELVAQLRAAGVALDAGDRTTALAHLLAAWRIAKAPRIANVIDYVTAELRPQPVPGKTVAARTKAWLALATNVAPEHLPSLLVTPFPKTISPLLEVIGVLVALPPDPRVAHALVRCLLEVTINTSAGAKLDNKIIAHLATIGDVRVAELLATTAAGTHRGWRKTNIDATTEALGAVRWTITDGAEAELTALESRYRAEVASTNDRSGDELVAAILADPDNLAAYAVYADWLVEREDPRGELISLQLADEAGTLSAAGESRIRKLLDEHRTKWRGPIGRFFEDNRVFERGFFAGGRLIWLRAEQLDELCVEPMLPLIRVLEVTRVVDEVVLAMFARPELSRVHTIGILREPIATRLATGTPHPNVRELHFAIDDRDGLAAAARDHAKLEAFPNLVALGIHSSDPANLEVWCRTAPVVARVTKLFLPMRGGTPRVCEILGERAGALRTIEIYTTASTFGDGSNWSLRMHRDVAPGPFTRIEARFQTGPTSYVSRRYAYTLAALLQLVPQAWVRSLAIEPATPVTLPSTDREHIEAALAQLPNLVRGDMPWAPPVVKTAIAAHRITARINGTGLFVADKLEPLWKLLTEQLGQTYDAFSVGYGNKQRSLGADPLARMRTWVANPRANELRLLRDGYEDAVSINRGARGYTILELGLSEAQLAGFLDWFVELLALGSWVVGDVAPTTRTNRGALPLGGFAHQPALGWIYVLGATLPIDQVRALAELPELRGLQVRAAGGATVIAVAPTPAEVTADRNDALARELREILYRELVRTAGYDFSVAAHAAFDGVAEELGLSPVALPLQPLTLQYAVARGARERRIAIDLEAFSATRLVRVTLESRAAATFTNSLQVLERTPAMDRPALETALGIAAERVRETAVAFYEKFEVPA